MIGGLALAAGDAAADALTGWRVPAASAASRNRSSASPRSISVSSASAAICASLGVFLRCQLPGQRIGCTIEIAGGVAADQLGGQRARLVEQGQLLDRGRGLLQPPVQMHLRLDLAGLVVDPFAAALDHDGGRAEQGFELARAASGVWSHSTESATPSRILSVLALRWSLKVQTGGRTPPARTSSPPAPPGSASAGRTRDRPAGAPVSGRAARSCRYP